MSWVQLLGKTWRPTDDEAELHVHLWRPDAGCPRQSWSLRIGQGPHRDEPDSVNHWLSIEIGALHFFETDWRRFSNHEIRADWKWHEANEFTHEYGRLELADVRVTGMMQDEPPTKPQTWLAHDFNLRFGTRDGFVFPCELDAWLIPKADYKRKVPESVAEVERFGEGPPNLRVMTRAVFSGGTVVMPRCGDDPLPLARRYLREAIGLEEVRNPKVHWTSRRTPDGKESVEMPGWTSRVKFSTSEAESQS